MEGPGPILGRRRARWAGVRTLRSLPTAVSFSICSSLEAFFIFRAAGPICEPRSLQGNWGSWAGQVAWPGPSAGAACLPHISSPEPRSLDHEKLLQTVLCSLIHLCIHSFSRRGMSVFLRSEWVLDGPTGSPLLWDLSVLPGCYFICRMGPYSSACRLAGSVKEHERDEVLQATPG